MKKSNNQKLAVVLSIIASFLTIVIVMVQQVFKADKIPSMGSDKPRGVRNNNPLNLRRTAIKWNGERSEVIDNEFEEFETMAYGLRAGLVNMRTQMSKGFDSLEKLIGRWAPPTENNTSNYVRIVSEKSGYSPTHILAFEKDEMKPVVSAMVKIESGMNLTDQLYEEAWELI